MTAIEYVISFLIGDEDYASLVWYGEEARAPIDAKLIIIPSFFFDVGTYGTQETLPHLPFKMLPKTKIPFLFGQPKIENDMAGHMVLYADLVASAYFLLSRYEEIIKPEVRDQYGRFLAKDSIVFQQGYGLRPLVDEWGQYIYELLRDSGASLPSKKKGIRKIYLTHDVDVPFKYYRKGQVVKQWIKNVLNYDKRVRRPLYIYRHPEKDPQNTFKKIIETDNNFRKCYGTDFVESIYFLIAAGSKKTKSYCDIHLKKYRELMTELIDSGATIGLHVSHEAGMNPELIKNEMQRLMDNCPASSAKSRHHYLRWTEPEHVEQMACGGISEDFTLEYADSVGFRVGTCRPYFFINPVNRQVSSILVHPMAIMECSLDRPNYMGLLYDEAFDICKQLIDMIQRFNGELVLLFHNPIWSEENYYGKLYENILLYLLNCDTISDNKELNAVVKHKS